MSPQSTHMVLVLHVYGQEQSGSVVECFTRDRGVGLLRVSEYWDIRGSEYKIEYEYSSLPKSLDRNFFFFFFFLPFLLMKLEIFHKMVY